MAVAREQKPIERDWSLDAASALCLVVTVFLICYVLYSDSILPFSINAVWECLNRYVNCSYQFQLVTVGLLPVYVAMMIFGAACVGLLAGYAFRALVRRLRR